MAKLKTFFIQDTNKNSIKNFLLSLVSKLLNFLPTSKISSKKIQKNKMKLLVLSIRLIKI